MSGWGPKVIPPTGGGGSTAFQGVDKELGDQSVSDSVLSIYSEVLAVPASVETVVLTYLAPGSTPTHLVRAEFGGTNIGQYRLYINNIIQAQFITWFNGPMSSQWNFDAEEQGVAMSPGDVVKITAQHGRPFMGDYFARLTVIRVDA